MSDPRDAAIEAAAEAMSSTVPNQDGVLWMFDEVVDQRTGMTQPRPVTLADAGRAAYDAIAPILREQIAQEIEGDYANWEDDGSHEPATAMRWAFVRAAAIVRGDTR